MHVPEFERNQVAAFVAGAQRQQWITFGVLESGVDARRASFAEHQVGYDKRLTCWHGGSALMQVARMD
jgi:hypothetical protein